jgi:hypothetical protein
MFPNAAGRENSACNFIVGTEAANFIFEERCATRPQGDSDTLPRFHPDGVGRRRPKTETRQRLGRVCPEESDGQKTSWIAAGL